MNDGPEDMAQDPDADRFRIEILSWDWNLAVSLSSDSTPEESRFQGGLAYSRAFDLRGRVMSPKAHRGRTIRIWITSFGPELTFGAGELSEVGYFFFSSPSHKNVDLEATLLLPQDATSPLSTYLSSVSRYVFISIFDRSAEQARISSYFFSSTLPQERAFETLDDEH